MGVNHGVDESVDTSILIDADCTYGLFTHGRLICISEKLLDTMSRMLRSIRVSKYLQDVPGTLVVMRIRDKTSYNAQ